MSKAVKVLVVEDSEDDASLMIRSLQRGGFEPQHERVESAAAMEAALKRQKWDAVISDFNMPDFTGLDALKIVRSTGLDVPFILISGAIGEEAAVQAMKAGASDYVLKANLARLAPVLERELKEAGARAALRQAQRDLSESEDRFRCLTAMSSDFYWESDAEHRLTQRGSAKPGAASVFERAVQIGERSGDKAARRNHRGIELVQAGDAPAHMFGRAHLHHCHVAGAHHHLRPSRQRAKYQSPQKRGACREPQHHDHEAEVRHHLHQALPVEA